MEPHDMTPPDPGDDPPPTTLRITEVTVERVRNLGNYENTRFAATAAVDAGDDPAAVAAALRAFVAAQLGLKPRPVPAPAVPSAGAPPAPPAPDDDDIPF